MLSFHERVLNTSIYTTRSKRQERTGVELSRSPSFSKDHCVNPKVNLSLHCGLTGSFSSPPFSLWFPAPQTPLSPGRVTVHHVPRPLTSIPGFECDPDLSPEVVKWRGGRVPEKFTLGSSRSRVQQGPLWRVKGGRVEAAPDSGWGLAPGIGLRVRIGCGFLQSRSAQ